MHALHGYTVVISRWRAFAARLPVYDSRWLRAVTAHGFDRHEVPGWSTAWTINHIPILITFRREPRQRISRAAAERLVDLE